MKNHCRTFFSSPVEGSRSTNRAKLVFTVWSVLILSLASCTKTEHHNSELSSRAVNETLKGKLLYRTSEDKIVLKEFHGRSRTVGSSTVEGAKWSPDGSQFSFIESEGDVPYLSIFDQGGDRISHWELKGLTLAELAGLTWSPDGQYNALLKSGRQIVFIETATGKSSTYSLDPSHTFSSLAWCPSNNKIAVAEGRSIWLIDAFLNDPPATLLTSDQDPDPIEAMDWNTDGSKLVFSGGLAHSKLKLVDVDGKNCITLTYSTGGGTEAIQGAAPCWYSNGEQIMFVRLHEESIIWNIGLFITDPKKEYEVYLHIPGYDPDCI
ncbi:MAG: hypothetical protein ACWGNV_05675 [Bacteroidales bacterium]